jgi:hypothetical protein
MCAKRYEEIAVPSSVESFRKARKALKTMPKLKQLELMVAAGSLTVAQANRAKETLEKLKKTQR